MMLNKYWVSIFSLKVQPFIKLIHWFTKKIYLICWFYIKIPVSNYFSEVPSVLIIICLILMKFQSCGFPFTWFCSDDNDRQFNYVPVSVFLGSFIVSNINITWCMFDNYWPRPFFCFSHSALNFVGALSYVATIRILQSLLVLVKVLHWAIVLNLLRFGSFVQFVT